MSANDGAGTTVVATTVDILAPEYEQISTAPEDWAATGLTLSALAGDGVVTSIGTSNSLGINNQSIGNSDYEDFIQGNTAGAEGNDMNPGEAWVIEFDTAVTITEFNFSSIDNPGEAFEVTVEGGSTFTFGDGMAGDDFADPFNGLVIPAGTNLTFAAVGPIETTNIRIAEITVETIPEPSSLLMLGLGAFGVSLRRRR